MRSAAAAIQECQQLVERRDPGGARVGLVQRRRDRPARPRRRRSPRPAVRCRPPERTRGRPTGETPRSPCRRGSRPGCRAGSSSGGRASAGVGRNAMQASDAKSRPSGREPKPIAVPVEQPAHRSVLDASRVAPARVATELRGERAAADALDPPQAESDRLEGAGRLVERLGAAERTLARARSRPGRRRGRACSTIARRPRRTSARLPRCPCTRNAPSRRRCAGSRGRAAPSC